MRLLVDTQLLIWSAADSKRLSRAARDLILDAELVAFSVASIWEVAIKWPLRKPDFDAEPKQLRDALLRSDYIELSVEARHALAVADLPLVHGDPFDRLLVAQAHVEGLTFLTSDRILAGYGAFVTLA